MNLPGLCIGGLIWIAASDALIYACIDLEKRKWNLIAYPIFASWVAWWALVAIAVTRMA